MAGNSSQSDGEAHRTCIGSKFLFSCKKNLLSSVWLGSDGRKHSRTVIEELKSTCCGDVEQGPYKSSAPWGGGCNSMFVCSAAKQTRTLVNGQHQISLMERLRNHARTCMQPNWLISITMNHKGAYKTICSLHFHYQQNQQCSAAANRGKRALILWMWWLQALEFCLHQNGLIKLTVLKLKWGGDLKLSLRRGRWVGGGKFSPSGYSQWKTSHLWSHDSSLHCALTSAFTLITTQLMAQNRENREAHYCSCGLLAGLFFFFSTEEAAKHSRNKCSLFCCVYPYCMTQWF